MTLVCPSCCAIVHEADTVRGGHGYLVHAGCGWEPQLRRYDHEEDAAAFLFGGDPGAVALQHQRELEARAEEERRRIAAYDAFLRYAASQPTSTVGSFTFTATSASTSSVTITWNGAILAGWDPGTGNR